MSLPGFILDTVNSYRWSYAMERVPKPGGYVKQSLVAPRLVVFAVCRICDCL
jgi:hypothetical protein